jgi:uncharacterized protein
MALPVATEPVMMMSGLRPWLQIAKPRSDIADGSFDESLFAADLGMVDRGRGPADYLNPVTFCEKTYLTENLLAFLGELAARLDGDSSAAGVYRLQTEFGGGKTHTLLAAYHLFRDPSRIGDTQFVIDLREKLGRAGFPQAAVVVLEGGALAAGEPDPEVHNAEVRTLLGHLAYRLGGQRAFAAVAEQDRNLRGSSTTQLAALLEAHAPCVILLDEMLQYLTKALNVRSHEGNLAATTITFIKELCSAASNVPRAAVVATLTSSHQEDYSTLAGEDMQQRLSQVVGRTENIITPVEGDDIFPILHRRLFSTIGPYQDRREVAHAYADWYQSLADAVPTVYRETSYRERLTLAFPFHPELVDILTNRWGSLSGFQRTRGALRILAHTVKALSQRRHKAPLIHPGDVSLADLGIRGEIIRFAGESFKSALNADIIRPSSIASAEDRRRGGVVEELGLATGLATTAFLNSFSSARIVGASAAQMLIGVGRPGLSRGLIEDVRDALEASLWYMRLEGGRYRFTTEPNLNKVVLEREGAITDDTIDVLVREAIAKVAPSTPELRLEPRVRDSSDLPDKQQLTLGILDLDLRVNGDVAEETLRAVREILEHCGASWRANKNAAMLVAADMAGMSRAKTSARNLAALRDLNDDKHRLARFNVEQREQLARRLSGAAERLPQQVTMAYRHLLLLGGDSDGAVKVDHIDLGPARANATITGRVLDYLRSADRIIETALAPAALLAARFGLLPEGTNAVELDNLLGYFCQIPRLPKLASPGVLRQALAEGVRRGLFGVASGSAWDAEDAVLRFSETVDPSEIQFQPGIWMVRASAIKDLIAKRGPSTTPRTIEPHPPPSERSPLPTNTTREAKAGTRGKEQRASRPAAGPLPEVTVHVKNVPANKMRDVLKVAVLPLSAASADVTVDLTIRANGGLTGIPRETFNLVTLEGLRQLGLTEVEVFPDDLRREP